MRPLRELLPAAFAWTLVLVWLLATIAYNPGLDPMERDYYHAAR